MQAYSHKCEFLAANLSFGTKTVSENLAVRTSIDYYGF